MYKNCLDRDRCIRCKRRLLYYEWQAFHWSLRRGKAMLKRAIAIVGYFIVCQPSKEHPLLSEIFVTLVFPFLMLFILICLLS